MKNTETEQRPAVVVHRPVGLSDTPMTDKNVTIHCSSNFPGGWVPAWISRELESENARLRDAVSPQLLADSLARVGLIHPDAIDQPEGYDMGRTFWQIKELSADILQPNVEVTGDPLEAARGAGMFVIYLNWTSLQRTERWIVRWTVLFEHCGRGPS